MRASRVLALLLILVMPGLSCGKKKTQVRIPPSYQQAREADWPELVSLLNDRYAGIETLTISRMRIEFTGGSVEKGYLEEYPTARGHLVAGRPDSIYVNILNPVTTSTVVTMAASGGRFQVWIPRENKYLVGSTDIPADSDKPLYSVRPDHLLDAILIGPLHTDDRNLLYFLQEDQDYQRKYYVIHEVDLSAGREALCLRRKLWIERGGLSLSRQQLYRCGVPVGDIAYAAPLEVGERTVSTTVSVERIPENYTVRLEFDADTIRVDRELKEGTFEIPFPPGAELVEVKPEKVN